jgi:hypothetical protein
VSLARRKRNPNGPVTKRLQSAQSDVARAHPGDDDDDNNNNPIMANYVRISDTNAF